ncbi:helix-turn-helix domain-containing protein [Ollibium composti]|uniref:helix-turn-helix domain-containing protein n=1 Tax=Ollibium composti TaxID=2675109 RepID=UPI001454BA11|nr:helix-turn-helix domain-containing protein [Mesorhizobium composti]
MTRLNKSVKPNPLDASDPPERAKSSLQPSRFRGEQFFTIKQLAKRWQVSERQVHRFVHSGVLVAHKFGRSLRIAEDNVLLFELRSR